MRLKQISKEKLRTKLSSRGGTVTIPGYRRNNVKNILKKKIKDAESFMLNYKVTQAVKGVRRRHAAILAAMNPENPGNVAIDTIYYPPNGSVARYY